MVAVLSLQDPVTTLIERLGSESVEERDEASRQLHRRAAEAEGALETAAGSADPEVAARARSIVDELRSFREAARGELSRLLRRAAAEFDAGHFSHSVVFCDLALAIVPRLDQPRELRRLASAGCWAPLPPLTLEASDLRDLRLPVSGAWRRPPRDPEDPDDLAIERKLKTMKIDLGFENTRLEDILAFIRDFSGLNLMAGAGIDLKQPMDFKRKDAVLGEILDCLSAGLGLTWAVTEEKVLLIDSPRGWFNLDERDPDRY